jgi:ribosomal-protein-serine acetyltransferase
MFIQVYEFYLEPENVGAFELANGPNSTLREVLGKSEDFLGAQLITDNGKNLEGKISVFSIDKWTSKEHFIAYYQENDHILKELSDKNTQIIVGRYEYGGFDFDNPITIEVDDDITLRQYTTDDIEDMFDLINRNREHLNQHGEKTSDKYQSKINVVDSILIPSDPDRLRFGIWAGDTYVGTINLTPDYSGRFEIGYYLGNDFMNKRYMIRSVNRMVQYAFDELDTEMVYAKIHPLNIKSQSVVSKAGFIKSRNDNSNPVIYGIVKK